MKRTPGDLTWKRMSRFTLWDSEAGRRARDGAPDTDRWALRYQPAGTSQVEAFHEMTDATMTAADPVRNAGPPGDSPDRMAVAPATTAPTFGAVVDTIGNEIYRFAWQLTCNKSDADDLYQETLLKAFRAFPKLPADANHRAWFYRITSNTFISDRRKRNRENPLSEAHEQTLRAETQDNARAIDARDLLREVEAFVFNLPPKQRVALVLRKHHGLGYDHIADSLNSSEEAARANVHEALRKLRSQFADRLEG